MLAFVAPATRNANPVAGAAGVTVIGRFAELLKANDVRVSPPTFSVLGGDPAPVKTTASPLNGTRPKSQFVATFQFELVAPVHVIVLTERFSTRLLPEATTVPV